MQQLDGGADPRRAPRGVRTSSVMRPYFSPGGIPSNEADAVRASLFLALVEAAEEAGVSYGVLAHARLWLERPNFASIWMSAADFSNLSRWVASVPGLADAPFRDGVCDLMRGLGAERAVVPMDDADGAMGWTFRVCDPVPRWVTRSTALEQIARVMLPALRRAERG